MAKKGSSKHKTEKYKAHFTKILTTTSKGKKPTRNTVKANSESGIY